MHKKARSLLLVFVLVLVNMAVMAQDTATGKPVEMADELRADGKIYVVVAVLVTILLGLIAYVIRLDKKISRMEKGSK